MNHKPTAGDTFWPVMGALVVVDVILCSALWIFGEWCGWWEWIVLHGGQ